MGNAQPTNSTGRKATAKKLENAQKLGVLSLSEHKLESLPPQLFDSGLLAKLRTLDLSKNKLESLERLGLLTELKTLHCDDNLLGSGSLEPIAKLQKLQVLSVARNKLGANPTSKFLPSQLPVSLKQLTFASNAFSSVPRPVLSASLVRLEKLDLSHNQLATIPEDVSNLIKLQELLLDGNTIVSLPDSVGQLAKLKVLSLRHNQITVTSTTFTDKNPQPLPAAIFMKTALIDLNLHGNRLSNTQLNAFDGFQQFLDRRQKVKSKTLTNLDVCGLE